MKEEKEEKVEIREDKERNKILSLGNDGFLIKKRFLSGNYTYEPFRQVVIPADKLNGTYHSFPIPFSLSYSSLSLSSPFSPSSLLVKQIFSDGFEKECFRDITEVDYENKIVRGWAAVEIEKGKDVKLHCAYSTFLSIPNNLHLALNASILIHNSSVVYPPTSQWIKGREALECSGGRCTDGFLPFFNYPTNIFETTGQNGQPLNRFRRTGLGGNRKGAHFAATSEFYIPPTLASIPANIMVWFVEGEHFPPNAQHGLISYGEEIGKEDSTYFKPVNKDDSFLINFTEAASPTPFYFSLTAQSNRTDFSVYNHSLGYMDGVDLSDGAIHCFQIVFEDEDLYNNYRNYHLYIDGHQKGQVTIDIDKAIYFGTDELFKLGYGRTTTGDLALANGIFGIVRVDYTPRPLKWRFLEFETTRNPWSYSVDAEI